MTLTIVVPAKDLDDLGSPLRLEDLQPPTSVPSAVRPVCAPPRNNRHAQTVISVSATRRSKKGDERKEGPTDEVLVEREGRLGAVVGEKARADGGHVRFSLCNQRAPTVSLPVLQEARKFFQKWEATDRSDKLSLFGTSGRGTVNLPGAVPRKQAVDGRIVDDRLGGEEERRREVDLWCSRSQSWDYKGQSSAKRVGNGQARRSRLTSL